LEKQLEVLKKALEMGGCIQINFHQNKTKKEAENKIKELTEIIGFEYEEDRGDSISWFVAREGMPIKFKIVSFFKEEGTA
jgi:hypothetical protein